MRTMVAVLIFTIFILSISLYAFKGIVPLLPSGLGKSIFRIAYWVVIGLLLAGIIYMFSNFDTVRSRQPQLMMWLMSAFFVVFMPLLLFSVFHLLEDIGWLGTKAINSISNNGNTPSRRRFISKVGLGLAGLMSGAFTYGILWGKYQFRVLRHEVTSTRLPKAFDGTKVVQISDAHLGSFVNNFEPIERMVKMINDLEPDFVFFTGDMVNNHADEAEAWIPVFKKIQAKQGKYSVFGNHDYADYGDYSASEKEASRQKLKDIHHAMGFRLLEDEHEVIKKDGEQISIIGMHNWGHGFHQVGDINKAMQGVPSDNFKLLLSHDPTNWEHNVLRKKDIDITFSGHTHGMQMGIEIPSLGIKWSPIKLRYKRWAGLYTEGKQHLHVNRGLGVLAYPGRVGMPPEITLMELRAV